MKLWIAPYRVFVLVLLASCAGVVSAAEPIAQNDTVWTLVNVDARAVAAAEPWVQPAKYQAARLDAPGLANLLANAPLESNVALNQSDAIISLPMPDGSMARFSFVASPVMEPALAAKYPEITTYVGRGIDDPAASIRFDSTPAGFHAQILSPHGAVYVDPLWRGDSVNYASYYKRDYVNAGRGAFECLTNQLAPEDGGPNPTGSTVAGAAIAATSGDTLRTYRLAVATTGEYTQFHGGGVANGLAAVVTAVNRVTGIYEIDFAIRMKLVGNNDLIIFTSPTSDPYSNTDGFAMLSQNQNAINAIIGSANYDIGHVFSTGGGGVASFQAVCRGSRKAMGVTGLPAPIGDSFYIDFVAHEMGHQFGGSHSFNGTAGSCCCGNRSGSTAMEPGSGSTIMAYAGICGSDNLQTHSDPYFHAVNIQEISSYVQAGFGSTCSSNGGTGNTPPTVSAGPDYTIPSRTPFALTATASDVDATALLSYTWEEYDLGNAVPLSAPDNGIIPLFRSYDPVLDPTRTFPQLSRILSGSSSFSEKLPTTNRTMRFRVTVRDNQPDGGGVERDDTLLTVDASAGPFTVTSPTSTDSWVGSGTVTWNVAGTDSGLVNTPTVNILLSTDGGLTFPTVLASNTPNDGSEAVTVTTLNTTTARIKVEGAGNVFFNINSGNFEIINCAAGGTPLAETGGIDKNRYLAFEPPAAVGTTAIQVLLDSLPAPFDGFNGQVRWAGPPAQYADGTAGTFTASRLQCDPFFTDWSTVGLLHVYGEGVVPSATYAISTFSCGAANRSARAAALVVTTRAWGDIVAPFVGESLVQPDFLDISATVQGFLDSPSSPGKVRTQLDGDSPNPVDAVSFKDITQAVQAFLGNPYPFSGPLVCP